MSSIVSRTWLCSFRSMSGASLLLSALFLPSMACSPTSTTGNTNANTNDNGTGGQMFTVTFDGDGGITSSGTTDFAFNGASFSGGTVKTLMQQDLYGSGLFAYEVLDGSTVTVMFDNPIDSLALFFVARSGQTTLTARDAGGAVVGTATAAQPGSGNERVTVTLSANATSVDVAHTGGGEGWIDDFQFGFASAGGG